MLLALKKKKIKIKNLILNFGPQHPAAHGVLRLILEVAGEIIINADPHVGLLHRGTEKLLEFKNYLQGLPYFDRLDYVSMMASEHAYSLIIESLNYLKINKRTNYIRMLFLELTRILNHLLAVSCHALDVGATTPLLWLFEEREKIIEFYERVSGARMHAIYIRPGGIFQEIPLFFLNDLFIFLKMFMVRLKEINELLSNNRIWKQRLVNIGYYSAFNTYESAFSGVMLRGSGTHWDLRKDIPYEKYNEISFKIPIGTSGDSLDRYLLRIYEMFESIKIINIFFKNIIDEKVKVYTQKLITTKQILKKKMENLITHYLNFTKGFKNLFFPIGIQEAFAAVEAPKGEFSLFLVSLYGNKPYRIKIKAPSFINMQSLTEITKRYLIADIVTILGTIDIVFGELDK
jgi:NADH dehydrogenase I D subunit